MHSFKGGIHPMRWTQQGKKPTRNRPIKEFVSDSVCILMGMHIGAPSEPCVQKGDQVKIGQVIGQPVGALGLPVHASVSGEVAYVGPRHYVTAVPMQCVMINNDFQDTWIEEGMKGYGSVEKVNPSLIIPRIREAGICGMGGASFPTHVKLTIPPGKHCDTIIINGAECETFLTADERLMIESPGRVVNGLRAAMRALGVGKGVIAIEKNKPGAIEAIEACAHGRSGVSVLPLRTKYPQGGEKQLIEAVTGREVPSGKLPIDVHTIVLNVGTAAAIADAVTDGRPLISRVTTVTGRVQTPSNLLLRIGTILGDAIGECNGYSETPGKIALGGGMTGICVSGDDIPMTKATNGIVVYGDKEARSLQEGPCIRCGRCVETCPMGLNPYLLKPYCDQDEMEKAREINVMDCIVCGCCSYVCPARRWLTAAFKNTKDKIALSDKKG